MLRREAKNFILYGPPSVSETGEESRRVLGMIRAAVSFRSAEERAEDGVLLAAETAAALIPARYTPPGGFRRGMQIADGNHLYEMQTPVNLGRRWAVKCVRIHI